MNDLRYAPQWTPAYAHAPYPAPAASLGQVQPTIIYAQTGFEQFMSSPGLALATDVTLVGVGAFVALHLGRMEPPSGWSTFWWALVTAGVMKGLHDFKRLQG